MNISIRAKINCPFFITEKNNLLCCEGFVENTCMTTKFPDSKKKTEHIKKNCLKIDGGGCPLATSLYAKYKAIEEKEDKLREKKAQNNIRNALKKTG